MAVQFGSLVGRFSAPAAPGAARTALRGKIHATPQVPVMRFPGEAVVWRKETGELTAAGDLLLELVASEQPDTATVVQYLITYELEGVHSQPEPHVVTVPAGALDLTGVMPETPAVTVERVLVDADTKADKVEVQGLAERVTDAEAAIDAEVIARDVADADLQAQIDELEASAQAVLPVSGVWNWPGALTSTPSKGQVSADAVPASAATLYFHTEDALKGQFAGLLAILGVGSSITAQATTTAESWARYAVTGEPTVVGSVVAVPVSVEANGTAPLTGWTQLRVVFTLPAGAADYDSITSILIDDADSDTRASLDARDAAVAARAALPTPLYGIRKAASAPFRVMHVGTSLANNSNSASGRAIEQLVNLYGRTTTARTQMGLLGGSYTAAQNGWDKQPFSGQMFTRLRGKTASSTLSSSTGTLTGYCDEIVVEWSREADGGTTEVFIDGVSAGTINCAGTQKFGMRTKFSVAKGTHTVTFGAPPSGYAYLEAVEFREATRKGVEHLNFTLGGSSLSRLETPASAQAPQVAPLTTQFGAGVSAVFGRDDIDLIVMSFIVNDAGGIGDDDADDYRDLLERCLRASGETPVLMVIEPAGHYRLTTDPKHARYLSVVAHAKAVAASNPRVAIADWDAALDRSDIEAYGDTYYTMTWVDVEAGTYTGDFTHPNQSGMDVGLTVVMEALGLAGHEPTSATQTLVRWEPLAGADDVAYRMIASRSDVFAAVPVFRDPAGTGQNSTLHDQIAASPLSDANGKYLTWTPNTSISRPNAIGEYLMVLKMGPKDDGTMGITVTSSAFELYDLDGGQILTPGTSRSVSWTGLPAGFVMNVALRIKATATNGSFVFSGRLYDLYINTNPDLAVVGPNP